jgi:PAS domain S-box-containing protein
MGAKQAKGYTDGIRDALTLRREVFLTRVFTLAATVPFIFFGLVHIYTYGNYFIGYVEIALGCAIAINYLIFHITQHIQFAKYFLIFSVLAGLLAIFISGGIEGTGIYWLYVFPSAVFAWFGVRRGLYLAALMLGACFIIIAFHTQGLVPLPYSAVVLRQFFASLLVLFAVSFWSEMSRDREESERKTAERELAERVAEDEAILTNIGDGLVVIDAHQNILLINSAAEKILGFAASEVAGKNWHDSVPLYDAKKNILSAEKTPIGEAMAGGKVVTIASDPYFFAKKDGSLLPVAITASPVVVGKEVVGVIIIFRDVTKEAEIDRAKTEFVALASHQLRTPLTAIKWFVDLLLEGNAGALNVEQRKQLEEVYRGNERMVALVNSLLNVSRLELGTFAVDPELIDIMQIADEVLDELRPQSELKRIGIHRVYEKGLGRLYADPKWLEIIFQNLLSNAVKYTPQGGRVTLEIATCERGSIIGGRALAVDSIAIQVADSGYGIPASQHEGIFKKLFRADNIRRNDTEGNGLGLYIVKSIVEKLGGSVWFESEENKGSTFFVTIPLDRIRMPSA